MSNFTLFADIVISKDGTVILGTLKSATPGAIIYASLGHDVTILTQDVIRTETSIAAAKDLYLEVKLVDGSILKGTIADFDEGIGLFVDLGFGVVTVPIESIAGIYQPKQRTRYQGAPNSITLGFALMQPVSTDFGLSLGGNLVVETAIPGAAACLSEHPWAS